MVSRNYNLAETLLILLLMASISNALSSRAQAVIHKNKCDMKVAYKDKCLGDLALTWSSYEPMEEANKFGVAMNRCLVYFKSDATNFYIVTIPEAFKKVIPTCQELNQHLVILPNKTHFMHTYTGSITNRKDFSIEFEDGRTHQFKFHPDGETYIDKSKVIEGPIFYINARIFLIDTKLYEEPPIPDPVKITKTEPLKERKIIAPITITATDPSTVNSSTEPVPGIVTNLSTESVSESSSDKPIIDDSVEKSQELLGDLRDPSEKSSIPSELTQNENPSPTPALSKLSSIVFIVLTIGCIFMILILFMLIFLTKRAHYIKKFMKRNRDHRVSSSAAEKILLTNEKERCLGEIPA